MELHCTTVVWGMWVLGVGNGLLCGLVLVASRGRPKPVARGSIQAAARTLEYAQRGGFVTHFFESIKKSLC